MRNALCFKAKIIEKMTRFFLKAYTIIEDISRNRISRIRTPDIWGGGIEI